MPHDGWGGESLWSRAGTTTVSSARVVHPGTWPSSSLAEMPRPRRSGIRGAVAPGRTGARDRAKTGLSRTRAILLTRSCVRPGWRGRPAACNLSDEEWRLLIEHYAAVHSIHPSEVNRSIPNAVLSFAHPREAAGGVLMELARILALEEDRDRPWYQGLSGLAGLMAKATFSTVPAPCLSFARCDPILPTSFGSRVGGLRWIGENSGWSDPAFELGDLAAHPAYCLVVKRPGRKACTRQPDFTGRS